MAAVSDMTEEEIGRLADECANRFDHNTPCKTSSYEGFAHMLEEGMANITTDKVFMDYMNVNKEKK